MKKKTAAVDIEKDLLKHQNLEKKKFHQKYFQAYPGGHGEGDEFLGVVMPDIRKVAKSYYDLSLESLQDVIASSKHEVRMVALVVLVHKYKKASTKKEKKNCVTFYLDNLSGVNQWDLVDVSAHAILGDYYADMKGRPVIIRLAKSERLWDRRISVISTLAMIKRGEIEFPLSVISKCLPNREELMHKACGWMLREIWKQDKKAVLAFIDTNLSRCYPITLYYALEKESQKKRKDILKKASLLRKATDG